MIDINKLRRLAQANYESNSVDSLYALQDACDYKTILDLLDRLEAAESECLEESRLNGMGSEREAALMAKLEAAENAKNDWLYANAPGGWIDNLRIDNEALRAEVIHIKEVEFPRKAQAVADGWRGKCERLEAKIAETEKQEPVGVLHVGSYYGEELQDWEFEADQRVCDRLNERHVNNPTSLNLYALPGAQPEPIYPDFRSELSRLLETADHLYNTGEGEEAFEAVSLAAFNALAKDARDASLRAQPAPSVPREAIEKMLTQLMDIAVSNGANSISMPDEYVEVAAWLCGIPAQPTPEAKP